MREAWLALLGGARMLVAGCDFAMLFSTHVARLKGWLMQDPRTRYPPFEKSRRLIDC
jgi:hypothetical protein